MQFKKKKKIPNTFPIQIMNINNLHNFYYRYFIFCENLLYSICMNTFMSTQIHKEICFSFLNTNLILYLK